MTETLLQRIDTALRAIDNPRLKSDVVTAGMVRDIGTTTSGKVRFTLVLDAADEATLVRDVRQAVEKLEGVTEVRIDVKDPSQVPAPSASARPPRPPGTGRALPMLEQPPAQPRTAAPTPVEYPGLGNVIAVSSGKGGVGKSTVTVNLAAALARSGARVGILDADVYGPNIPRMMGVNSPPPVINERIMPLAAHGVKVMSLGFLIDRDQPAIWRGPIVMKIITQFLRDVEWGELDYLLVDMPPGTGDAQLSLVQATLVRGAIIVTTPQQVATGDALRGAKMFERTGVPVLGIVENMAGYTCTSCGNHAPIFGAGGGASLAAELSLPLLGEIPMDAGLVQQGDAGMPFVLSNPDAPAGAALLSLAERVAEAVSALAAR
jgi:ATP-binding protein involved in chromosome partitioning